MTTETLTRQTDIEHLLPLKEVLALRARLLARESFIQESLDTLTAEIERFVLYSGVVSALDEARVGLEGDLPRIKEAVLACQAQVEHEGWLFLKRTLGADRGICIRPPRGGEPLRLENLSVDLDGAHVRFEITGARVDEDGLPIGNQQLTWAFQVKNVRDQVEFA